MSIHQYDFRSIRKQVKKALDKERYEHTKGVMYTACSLAMAHEADFEKAMLAGLLHDCAKCLPGDEKVRLCRENNILINEVEMVNTGLLHAKVGALLAERDYGITDPEILHAIKVHTTGEPGMNMMDKIIFIADYIEPGRYQAPRLEYIRALAFRDLDKCMAEILSDTLHYLNSKKGAIDPVTQMTFDYYQPHLDDSINHLNTGTGL